MNATPLTIPLDLQSRLQSCPTLPSPPKVAMQILELIKDPDLKIEQVIKTISKDPALFIKILRMANSAHYSYQHKVDNIEKAIMIVGLNGILSLALSFSLATSLRTHQGEGLNYQWYWLRALIAGSACRTLGKLCNRRDSEELFTAAFLQDMGMIVLDQMDPTIYTNIAVHQYAHQDILTYEQKHLGTSHADVGGWLLAQWNFPSTLVQAIRFSDEPDLPSAPSPNTLFFKCVALAGAIADLYLTQADDETFLTVADRIEMDLGRGALALPEILKMIKGIVNENASLFDIECGEGFAPDRIYDQARELLVNRNIHSAQPVDVLASNITTLQSF